MLLWGIIWGAVVGGLIGDSDGLGSLLGALIGWAAGYTLRRVVRGEIAQAVQQAQLIAPLDTNLSIRPTVQPAARTDAVTVITAVEPLGAAPAAAATLAVSDQPAPPRKPSILATGANAIWAAARGWLLGGNLIVRVGLIILFVGLSFLARYAASAGLFPIELRLLLVVGAGIALLVVGYRTRGKRRSFALALQGTGIATIYLTLFAATSVYALLPAIPAFVLMILVCALACALALLEDAESLAVAAFAGALAVPVLLPGGRGGDVGVLISFVYFTIQNIGLLFIAWRRSWRVLNLVGFFATFGIAGLFVLGAAQSPALYPGAQVFLLVSVLIYVLAGAFYARNTPGRLGRVVDGTLLFGPAVAGFGLQVALVHDRPFGAAFSALGFAALYLAIAWGVSRRQDRSFGLLREGLLAIAIGFVTLAVPLALGASWTSAAWAVEGAGAIWLGIRQVRWVPRMFGLALQAVAASLFVANQPINIASIPFANPAFMGGLLIALSVLASAWWLRSPAGHVGTRLASAYARAEVALARPLFGAGFLLWWLALGLEATRQLPPRIEGDGLSSALPGHLPDLLTMLAFVASAWGFDLIGRRKNWSIATWPGRVTLVAIGITFLAGALTGYQRHVVHHPDWIVWMLAIGLHLRLLFLADRIPSSWQGNIGLTRANHVGGVWLGSLMAADSLSLAIDLGSLWQTSWSAVIYLCAATAVLLALTLWAGPAIRHRDRVWRWPLDRNAADYGWYAAAPIAALLLIDAVATALSASGAVAPLPYLPVLNPVDLSLGLALVALILWRRAVMGADPVPAGSGIVRGREAVAPLAGLAFVIVNSIWLRIAHQYLGVPWTSDALLASFAVQMGLAILWTLLALALMIWAHRQGNRIPWIVGAGLLGLVVVKLLLIDLNNAGGGARIVTFLVVGVLMLVVGYFVPLPPRAAAAKQEVPA